MENNSNDKITVSKNDILKIATDMAALAESFTSICNESPTPQCEEAEPLVTTPEPDSNTENSNSISASTFNNVCNVTEVAVKASNGNDLWSRLIRSLVLTRAVNCYMYKNRCTKTNDAWWLYRMGVDMTDSRTEWHSYITKIGHDDVTNGIIKFLEKADIADIEYLTSIALDEMELAASVINATVTDMKPHKFNRYFSLAKLILYNCAYILGYQNSVSDNIELSIEQVLSIIDDTGHACLMTSAQSMTNIANIIINQLKLIEKSLQYNWNISVARAFITDPATGKPVCVLVDSDNIVVKTDTRGDTPYKAVTIDITYKLSQRGDDPGIIISDTLYGEYDESKHLLSLASKNGITVQLKIDTKQPIYGTQSKWYPRGTRDLTGSKGMPKYLDDDYITRLVPSEPLYIIDLDPFKQEIK